MSTVTLSPKFQIVIPHDIRTRFDLRPGQKVDVLPYGGQILVVPVRDPGELRGFLRGMDATLEREEDRL